MSNVMGEEGYIGGTDPNDPTYQELPEELTGDWWSDDVSLHEFLVKIGSTDYSVTNNEVNIDGLNKIFKEAWEGVESTEVTINMEKAKDIMRDRLRIGRQPVLVDLDTQFMKALEIGADTASIVAEKQTLRDLTQSDTLVNATTPTELEAAYPDSLPDYDLVVVGET